MRGALSTRGRRLILLAGAILAGGLLILLLTSGGRRARPPSPSPPAELPALPAPPSAQFGANVNRLFNDRIYSIAEIDGQLQALRAAGGSVARSDTLWEVTEPTPPTGAVHHYQWAFDDEIAALLAATHLQWLPIIDYAPAWAARAPGQLHSTPRSDAEYPTFAAALAARYGPGGTFWRLHPDLPPDPVDTYEIWNEPDNPVFWEPAPDAGAYADLYLRARAAIKVVDPTARVIVGGLTKSLMFIPAMLEARPQLRGHIDGIAVHLYNHLPDAILANLRADRGLLRSLGMPGVPLYLTEFGWTTRPLHTMFWLPERLRPGYITATLVKVGHSGCGVAETLIYTWVTPERNPSDGGDWFGIHPPSPNRSSADSEAFATGVREAERAQTASERCG